jgi:signal peptidase I
MNKSLKYSLIAVGAAIILFQTAQMTLVLARYKTPSGSNFPTLKIAESIWVSRFLSPKKFSFVCFKWEDSIMGRHKRVFRLCGVEGDKIEIRDGILFVNGKNQDAGLSLAHYYTLKAEDAQKLVDLKELGEDNMTFISSDSVGTDIADKAIKDYSIAAKKMILSKDHLDPNISQRFSADWNQDQFGPVVVPRSKVFVLGDNRHSAEDSRYLGFIDKSSVVATVIGK